LKYFIDTEFIEDGKTIDLISIGIVAEDGREFYAENLDVDLSKASDWVKQNVISHLWSRQIDKSRFNAWSRDGGVGGLLTYSLIAQEVLEFCNPSKYDKPEFWAYYADYDHVALCQLFGTMMDLPKGFPMYTRDIKQTLDELGNPTLTKQSDNQHNALADAKWLKDSYIYLQQNYTHPAFN
jgi:hypothetical protein